MATETLLLLSLPESPGGCEITRVVHALRRGDRPMNAQEESVEVSVTRGSR